jgi:hypothetical protein
VSTDDNIQANVEAAATRLTGSRTLLTATAFRNMGKEVPPNVPDCAQLKHDGVEITSTVDGDQITVHTTFKNACWRWVELSFTLDPEDKTP